MSACAPWVSTSTVRSPSTGRSPRRPSPWVTCCRSSIRPPTEQAVRAEPAACCLNGQEFLQIGPEDTVFIFGAGFIGCLHAELAPRKGAKRVILSDISDAGLKVARALLPPLDAVNTA